MEFSQELFNDVLFLENKLFFLGQENHLLYLICVDIKSEIEIVFKESLMNIKEGLFEIGIKSSQEGTDEMDLTINGKPIIF
jgi:hypothetical protein